MNQIRASLLRGLAISIVTAGAGFFTTWGTTDDVKKAAIGAGAAFFAALLSRFGEGGYDAYRAANDIIKRSDVGAAERAPAQAPQAQPAGT
jgi:hypothetical protein